jgi:hypothetical protein
MAMQHDETVRRTEEHVQNTWLRIEAGRAEIERQRESVAQTERHLIGMSRWIARTEEQLAEQRARRAPDQPSS